MREARFLLVAGMIYALKGALSFAVRARFGTISRASSLATLRCAGSAAPSTTLTKPRPSSEDYRVLEELASRVVHGTTDKVVPAGSQLKRRRSWDLFLDQAGGSEAAVLVVNKKSFFTLDDARVALSLTACERAARYASSEESPKLLLVATRAGVSPVAGAFLRRGRNSGDSAHGATMIMRWEDLQDLIRDGGLGHYLATSAKRRDSGSGLPRAPAFALPPWLLEERERSAGANAMFDLRAPFEPSGDQPDAIEALARGLEEGKRHQTLLGATGTGKTFIVANVIQKASFPTLVLAPNKVLAAQLTNELRALFPNNAVEFFVSYYDYFMPEAFVSASDTYIDKVVQINDDIDRMRHSATRSLLERRDVIVVSSVSCIYGLGMPSKYLEASIRVVVGQEWTGGWRTLAQHLEQAASRSLFYSPQHDEEDFEASPRGFFRTTSDGRGAGVVEIGPAADEAIVRVTVDCDGTVSRVQVVPTRNEGGEGEQGGAPRSLSAVIGAQGVQGRDARDDHGSGQAPVVGHGDVEAHVIYPAKHHVVGGGEMEKVLAAIDTEMEERCSELGREGRVLEAERLRQRTENDCLLLEAVGTCKGVENYSRHLAGRDPGDPPETLVDYFPEDEWLLVVDESHVSAPQLGAMWGGDRARKSKLVEHGFRLPSALDNRPLKAGEFWSKVKKCIFVSATPGKFELELSNPEHAQKNTAPRTPKQTSEPSESTVAMMAPSSSAKAALSQETRSTNTRRRKTTGRAGGFGWDEMGDLVDAQAVIRPTGITDPPVDVRPSNGQVADLVQECKARGERGERVLVTALTKRMAEDLCAFLVDQGVATAYLHSGVKPMKRLELLQQLRSGEVDVIVGVNLLREGLNLPEVSLVCVLDADAEGFLRSDTALLQTIGRATRHQSGRAVLYADRVTPSMQRALAETDRRRKIQIRHNELHGITPSVARAASVGDSLLDSINKGSTNGRRGPPDGNGEFGVQEHVASWADHPLPPDQVQILYDLAARNGSGQSRRATQPSTTPPGTRTAAAVRETVPALVASEGTSRALKRLAQQAADKMAAAASKTDFKEAALWRDRRDALLSTMRQLKGIGAGQEPAGNKDEVLATV